MKPIEHRRLRALAKSWQRESQKLFKQVKRESKYAGQSHDSKGTGDEGWRQLIEKSATAFTLQIAAGALAKILESFEINKSARKSKGKL